LNRAQAMLMMFVIAPQGHFVAAFSGSGARRI